VDPIAKIRSLHGFSMHNVCCPKVGIVLAEPRKSRVFRLLRRAARDLGAGCNVQLAFPTFNTDKLTCFFIYVNANMPLFSIFPDF
jgi:hypothetical protein